MERLQQNAPCQKGWCHLVANALLDQLTPSLPECLMEFCKASLTFESVDEIL